MSYIDKISVGGTVYDIQDSNAAPQTEVDELKSAIVSCNDNGLETFAIHADFVNGNMANGVPVTSGYLYRVTTNTIISLGREIKLQIANGFRIIVYYFSGGAYSTNSGWVTGTYTVESDKQFKILIARVTENESEIADIPTFVSAITFNTLVQDEIIALQNTDVELDNAIDDLSAKFDNSIVGKETLEDYATFIRGNLANGTVYTDSITYRVASNTTMKFNRAINLTLAAGFRILYNTFVDGSYSSSSGWQTGPVVTIPADTTFKIMIARTEATEDTSEVADIPTFVSKVTFATFVQSEIESLDGRVTVLESDVVSLDEKIDDKTDFIEFVSDPNFIDDTNIIANTSWTAGAFRQPNGQITQSQYDTNYIASDFIPVIPGYKYRCTVNGLAGCVFEYYSDAKNDGEQVSYGSIQANTSFDITVPAGKTYMAINCSFNASNRVTTVYRLTQFDSEKGISIPRLVYGTQEWIGKKIVNFGDSIFGNARPPQDISTFIATLTGATVYNCGFGGCRMGYHTAEQFDAFSMYRLADAIADNDWDLQDTALSGENIPSYFSTALTLLKSIDFSEVDIVTISYGTNDFSGGLRLGGDNFYSTDYALKYSIETLLTAFPNLRIFVCMPMYRVYFATGTYTVEDDTNTKEIESWVGGGGTYKLTDFIEAERDVCKETQTPVLDTYYDLGINLWNWTKYIPATDGTHHNETGRKLIAEYIASHIW